MMSADEREPLLNSSATLLEVEEPSKQVSMKPTPLPKLQFFTVCFIQFAEPVTATVVYPFIVQLVRDTGVTGGDEAQNGYYAGFIESLFYASEALTTLQWGRLSDRIGRKSPLVFGTLGLAAAVTSFGIATEFWSLVIFRSLMGIFNGNIGITKAVMGEITDASNVARAFSLIPMVWGLGVTSAPVLGGLLSHPANRWPDTFGKLAFFHSHPYFLPCAIAAMVPLSAGIFTAIFMKETLSSASAKKRTKTLERSSTDLGPDENTTDIEPVGSEQPATVRSLMTPRVIITLVNYAFTVFMESASSAILPLLYASPISYGGLGLSSFQIGIIMSISGLLLGLSSMLLFPLLSRKFGLTSLYRIGFSGHLITQITYALMNILARRSGRVDGFVITVLVVQVLMVNFTVMTFSCLFIQINDAAPSHRALGTINGLAQTVATSCRIFAPILASSLFSLSQQLNLLGGTMVYCFLLVVVLCGLLVSLRLPRRLYSEAP